MCVCARTRSPFVPIRPDTDELWQVAVRLSGRVCNVLPVCTSTCESCSSNTSFWCSSQMFYSHSCIISDAVIHSLHCEVTVDLLLVHPDVVSRISAAPLMFWLLSFGTNDWTSLSCAGHCAMLNSNSLSLTLMFLIKVPFNINVNRNNPIKDLFVIKKLCVCLLLQPPNQ